MWHLMWALWGAGRSGIGGEAVGRWGIDSARPARPATSGNAWQCWQLSEIGKENDEVLLHYVFSVSSISILSPKMVLFLPYR